MQDKFKTAMNIILNGALMIAIVGVSYSWMLTLPSEGELVDYDRQLVVTSSSVTAKIYAYTGGQYVQQTQSPVYMGLLAPGVIQKYKIEITNTNSAQATTKVVLTDISGDIGDIGSFLQFGGTSPKSFMYTLDTKIKQNDADGTYYMDLYDNVKVPANGSISLYWYVTILTNATNLVSEKGIQIDRIAFIKP